MEGNAVYKNCLNVYHQKHYFNFNIKHRKGGLIRNERKQKINKVQLLLVLGETKHIYDITLICYCYFSLINTF